MNLRRLTYSQIAKLLVVAIMLFSGLRMEAQWLEGYSCLLYTSDAADECPAV